MNKTVPSNCPCCHQKMVTTELHCEQCGANITGNFVSPFQHFSAEEQLFIRDFILKDGSLKAVAQQKKISYPTVRKMLNQIINKVVT